MAFLDNIEKPSSGGSGGNYMKFAQGENKFRIVGSSDDKPNPGFIQGMVGWTTDAEGNRRPIRWPKNEQAPRVQFQDPPREFFAFIVWNYADDRIQILELTQAGLKNELYALAVDDEWGDPRKYDVAVIRDGEGKDTSYVMTPKPHKQRSDEINSAVKAMSVDLTKLYTGDDPFEVGQVAQDEEPTDGKDPF